jgi:signal transduction histidine kinase
MSEVGALRFPIVYDLVGELAAKYEEERRWLTRRRIPTACVIAATIVLFYALADDFLYPEHVVTLVSLRFASVMLCFAVMVLARGPFGKRFPYALGHALGIGLALTSSGIPVWLLGYSVLYYVGFILVFLGMALLLPGEPAHVIGLALSMLGLYVAASLLHGPIANWPAFACHASFIGTTVGIVVIGMRLGEKLRRQEFGGRLALQEAYESKSQLTTALVDKTAKLESLKREMEDLLYVTSHDLRAPLINVQGFSRELHLGLEQVRSHNGKSPETNAALAEIDESLQFILTGVTRMDSLITSLLTVSRIATRTNPTEAVDLCSLTQKIAESLHQQLVEKGVTLEIDPLPMVRGDSVRLGQLFGNLLDNAVKYMGNSREHRIRVGMRVVEDEERFFVRDTGPGIPQEEHEHVFRLFRRLANGDCPGEGIGLTMARKIVEKHGGRIWVESTPGAGTTFWFTLQSVLPALEIGGMQ